MIQLKNYMEEVVLSYIEEVIEDIDMCKCEKCIMDIEAIALNSLPSKYTVTEQGELFSKVDTLKEQFNVDVIAAIIKAAITVKNNPHH